MFTVQRLSELIRRSKPVLWVTRSIRNRLLIAMTIAGLLPLIAVAITINRAASDSIQQQTFDRLTAVRTIKASQLSQYFETIQNQAVTMAADTMVVDALKEFKANFRKVRSENGFDADDEKLAQAKEELKNYYMGSFSNEYSSRNPGRPKADVQKLLANLSEDSVILQYLYSSAANENPLGQKDKLIRQSFNKDKSKWSDTHAKYHPVLNDFRSRFGYYDIFLVDAASGDIVYTAFKELDFTTSLKTGSFADSGLGHCFKQVIDNAAPAYVGLVDYEPYLPSYNDAAGFVGSPIYDGGRMIGVLLMQLPIDRINLIMSERTGLGTTGETYAIGQSKVYEKDGVKNKPLFRNNSRFVADIHKSLGLTQPLTTTIINPAVVVDTVATRSALEGKSETRIIRDYRNEPVLSSWSPLTIYQTADGKNDITWALVSEMDLAEVRQPTNWMALYTWIAVAIGTVLVVFVAFGFASFFTRQTNNIKQLVERINLGDYSSRAAVQSEDELGDMAKSLNGMLDKTLQLVQSEKERDQMQNSIMKLLEEVSDVANGDLTVEAEVTADMTGAIADSFNYMILQLRRVVSGVKDATQQVSSSASEIQSATEHLANGSEAQARHLMETSTALNDMATSIQQVAVNVFDSSSVAEQARSNARLGSEAVQLTIEGMLRIREQVSESSKRFKRLGESSQAVGEIVQLISDIADRTSILALNASIQAAMAGDAGRGFAVVAEEVERLAERSNQATSEIATLIKTIQTETAEAITAMEESTREVVSGSKLPQNAGVALGEIESVSTRLAGLITQISNATTAQAREAVTLSAAMTEISEVTQHTASGTKQAAESVSHLSTLAQHLRQSVETFKVPA